MPDESARSGGRASRTGAGDVIVVTGAGGFLGSRVVSLFRRSASGARVIAVTRRAPRGSRREPGVAFVRGDLRSARVWRSLPSGVTHVIHLAASIPWNRDDADRPWVVVDNLAPIAHLVHESRRWTGLRQVVYASSVSVYEATSKRLRESSPTRPASVYGAAKLSGERLLDVLAQRAVSVACLRYSSVYGAGQYPGTVLPLLMDRARRGLPLRLFNATRRQDFVHVEDAARAAWLAYRRGAHGAFNIGAGRSVSMSALARAVIRACDAGVASAIVEDASTSSHDSGIRLDVGRARRELGYRARLHLDDGLRQLARELAGR